MICCLISSLAYFLGVIGLIRITYETYRIAVECFATRSEPLIETYGEGSYALVTGSTNGIGLEYCHYLASQGFNIVSVSRN